MVGLLSLASGSVAVGIIMLIAVPILIALLGFITGAISAWLYNFAAGKLGGVRFVLEGYDVVKKAAANPKPAVSVTKPAPPSKRYKCDRCQYSTNSHLEMGRHIMKVHGGAGLAMYTDTAKDDEEGTKEQ